MNILFLQVAALVLLVSLPSLVYAAPAPNVEVSLQMIDIRPGEECPSDGSGNGNPKCHPQLTTIKNTAGESPSTFSQTSKAGRSQNVAGGDKRDQGTADDENLNQVDVFRPIPISGLGPTKNSGKHFKAEALATAPELGKDEGKTKFRLKKKKMHTRTGIKMHHHSAGKEDDKGHGHKNHDYDAISEIDAMKGAGSSSYSSPWAVEAVEADIGM